MPQLTIEIRCHTLPGLRFETFERMHVGLERGKDVIDRIPGDAETARFSLLVQAVPGPEGGLDFRGPGVLGARGERFLRLSWDDMTPDGGFVMFRRAKLMLPVLRWNELGRAGSERATLHATLGLTDTRGGPLCAAVRPPAIAWRLDP